MKECAMKSFPCTRKTILKLDARGAFTRASIRAFYFKHSPRLKFNTKLNFAYLVRLQTIESWIDDPLQKRSTSFSMGLPRTTGELVCEMSA